MDTKSAYEPPEVGEGYPLYWSNISSDEDPLARKYTLTNSSCCAVGTPDNNFCCYANEWKAVLCEMDSGVTLHQVESNSK